ncbi:uncharacterized protein COLE_07576 [Cutaneotrichosporon oleaginosum]|uniref:uncharacterized protein n=1 Tax=Cutaneotrichosporon oleaginosum TaxID=879819 RepID=UPI001329E6D4|nr:hypothetical protein COLE_07576 [Cutaneotrichosporon oleaginosum]
MTAATTTTQGASNAASSSKRSASASASSPPPSKRARSIPADDDHEEDEELKELDPADHEMTEAELAKKARREARTLRNRESAQRSRNQRKAHLAWLEARVVELEAENRALRSGSAPSTPSKTRESSPAHSVLSLASDLGIPSEIVKAGCGVSLATVLPPPADVLTDIPNIEAPAPATPAPAPPQDLMQSPMTMAPSNPAQLYLQNEQLRWRVNMLENLVRQASSIFSSCPTGNATPAPFLPPAFALHQPPSHPGMEATLSPPLYASEPHHQVASPLHLESHLDATHHYSSTHTPATANGDASQSYVDLSTPLARHPAAVATPSDVSSQRRSVALQRARDFVTINLDSPATQRRLSVVARVIVELARLRGWTSASPRARPSSRPMAHPTSRSKWAARRRALGSRLLRRPHSTTRK